MFIAPGRIQNAFAPYRGEGALRCTTQLRRERIFALFRPYTGGKPFRVYRAERSGASHTLPAAAGSHHPPTLFCTVRTPFPLHRVVYAYYTQTRGRSSTSRTALRVKTGGAAALKEAEQHEYDTDHAHHTVSSRWLLYNQHATGSRKYSD